MDRFNSILEKVTEKLQEEISSLLGCEFTLASQSPLVIDKKGFLTELRGKQVCARIRVSGETDDFGSLIIGIKDAIRLGGTLIMLPDAELEEAVGREEYSEELSDSFGEIANIVASSLTLGLEGITAVSYRFALDGQEVVSAAKMESESDKPVSNQRSLVVGLAMTVEDRPLGNLLLVFPAALFDQELLREIGGEAAIEPNSVSPSGYVLDIGGQTEQVADHLGQIEMEVVLPDPAEKNGLLPAVERLSGEQLVKHKIRLDRILERCREKMAEEIGAMISAEVSLSRAENILINKADFFTELPGGKQIIAHMDILGDLHGRAHLVLSLRDAIRLGGILIMIPSQELDAVVAREEFGEDTKDAYGEIANIAAGSYTVIFEEQYNRRIRFVRNELTEVAPVKVVAEAPEPFVDGEYYASSMDLAVGGSPLGRVTFLIPAAVFGLEGLRDTAVDLPDSATNIPRDSGRIDTAGTATRPNSNDGPPSPPGSNGGVKEVDFLLVGDDFSEAAKIASVVEELGYTARALSFKDSLQGQIPGSLKAVYLVMREVNEQVFGVAIKISMASSLPLVAAGPGWTKSKVIKAVRYGVGDILLTPASREDIAENVHNNLLKKAA